MKLWKVIGSGLKVIGVGGFDQRRRRTGPGVGFAEDESSVGGADR